jgi:cysteine desulfurase|tara:strand:+ start:135 stop:1268 length:1134 start_codon:yes stop_codon:yes gene_type:complete
MNVYFDNAATTKLDNSILEKMIPFMVDGYGNPSSIHKKGREVKSAVEKARSKVANILNCEPGEIFFTSGGTEANNMFILNTVYEKNINTIITSKIEHHAVLHCSEYLQKTKDTNLVFVDIDGNGVVDLSDLERKLKTHPNALVSLMHGNNEIGNLLDIEMVSNLCLDNGAIFHSDTVQTVGHHPFNLKELGIHGIVGSAHKFHGPKGIGFLYLNNNHKITSFIHGGAQERNMRGGTENVYGIVGLSEALELAVSNYNDHKLHILNIKERMIKGLTCKIENIKFNGTSGELNNSLYTVLNVSIPNIEDQQMFLFNLDINNICASSGSACASGSDSGSHVLQEIKKHKNHVSVRFSFSKNNFAEEVDYVLEKIQEIRGV